MQFLNLISTNEALKILALTFKKPFFEELIPLEKANNRILSKSLFSTEDIPGFNRSTVDGYAIKFNDSIGSSDSIPAILSIKGEVVMGKKPFLSISQGETCKIPTGGMLPEGADSVCMIEYTEIIDEHTVLIYKPIGKGENIVYKGEDIKIGDELFLRGTKLNPMKIGCIASCGVSEVMVFSPIRVTVFSSGDELIPINKHPLPGQIRDINTITISNILLESGCKIIKSSVLSDDYDEFISALNNASLESDIIIISGGSSVGEKDHTSKAMRELSDSGLLFHGLSVKPGKPTLCASINQVPCFGLPGHPVSATILTHQLIIPFINNKLSYNEFKPYFTGTLVDSIHASPGKTNYIPIKIRSEDNQFKVYPLTGKSSLMSILGKSDGYIIIDESSEGYTAGSLVKINLFRN